MEMEVERGGAGIEFEGCCWWVKGGNWEEGEGV